MKKIWIKSFRASEADMRRKNTNSVDPSRRQLGVPQRETTTTKVTMGSPEATNVTEWIRKTNFDGNFSDKYWRTEQIELVKNDRMQKNYDAFKNELKILGRKTEDQDDVLVFSAETEKSCREISVEGRKVCLRKRHVLGYTGSGVHLVRNFDILTRYMAYQQYSSPAYIMVYKAFLGKAKPIVPRLHKEDNYVSPWCGFDCHVSARRIEPDMPICEALNCSYVFFYEYDDISSNTVAFPRQILPYAVLHLTRKHTLGMESPFLCVARDYNCKPVEVKGETRRGFRFTYSKHNKQMKPPKLNVDKQKLIQNSLKEQLLEMRTKGDSRTTPPALEKNAIEMPKQTMGNERLSKLSPPTLLKCDPVTVNFKGERFCVSPVISDKMIKLKQDKMFRNLETNEDINNEKDKHKRDSLNVRRLPRSMKPVVSLKRLQTDTKYRTKKSIILSEWCSQSVDTSACVEKVNVQIQKVNQQEDTLREKVNLETLNVNQIEDTLKVIQRISATEENVSIQKDRTNMESGSEIRGDKHSNNPIDKKDKTEYKEKELELNKSSNESVENSEESPRNTGNKAVAIDTIHILSTMKEIRSSSATLEDKIHNVSVNSKSVDVYSFTDSEENYDTDERNSREKTCTKEGQTLKSSRISPLKSLKDRSLSRERDPISTPPMYNKTISEKVLSSSNETKGKRKDTSKLKQCETEKGRKVGLTKEVVCNRDSKQVQNHIEMVKPIKDAASSDNLTETEITPLTSVSQAQTLRISSPKVENLQPATSKSVSHVNNDLIYQNEPKTTHKDSEISPFSRKEETFKNDSSSKDASGKFEYYNERAKTQTPKTIKDLFQEPLKFQLMEKMKSNPKMENVRLPVDIKLTTHAGLTKTTSPPAGVIAPAQLDCSPRVASANTSQSNFLGHQPTPMMTFKNNIQQQHFRQTAYAKDIPVIPQPIRENATDRIQSLVGYRFQNKKHKTSPICQTNSGNETKQSRVDQKCIPLTVLDCQEKEQNGRTLGKNQSFNTISKVHNHKASLHDKHVQKHIGRASFSQSKSQSAGCQTTSSATRDGTKQNRDMGMHLAKPRISPRDPRIAKQNTSYKTQNNSTPVDILRKDNHELPEPTLSEKPNQISTNPAKTSPSSDNADKPSVTVGQSRGKNNLGIDFKTAQKLQRVLRQHISEVNKHRSPVTTEAGIKVCSDRLDTGTITHISEAKEKRKQHDILVIASPTMKDFLHKNLAGPYKNVASDGQKIMDNIQTPDKHNVMIEHFDNDSQDTVIGGLELSPSSQDIATEGHTITVKDHSVKDQITQSISGPSMNNQIEFSNHFKTLKNITESGCGKEMEVDASNEVVLSASAPVSLSDSNASCFITEQENNEGNGLLKGETVFLDPVSVSPESEKCDKNDTKDSAQTHNNEGNKSPQKSTDPIQDDPEQISTNEPVEKEKNVLPDSENNEADVTKTEHAVIGLDRLSEFKEDGANPPVSIVKAEPLSIEDNISKEEKLHTSGIDVSDSNIDSESQADEANPAVSTVEADSLKVEDNSTTDDKLHTSGVDIEDSNISGDDDDDGPPDLTKGCCSSVFGNIHKLGKHDFPCGQSPKLCRSTIIDTLQELSYVLKVLNESSLNEGLNGNNIQNEKISLESISKAMGLQCLQEKGHEENDGNDEIKNDEQKQQEDLIAKTIKKTEEKNESTRVETKVINEKPTISISSQATTTQKRVEVKSHPEAIEHENAKDTDETLVSQNESILSSEVKKEPIEMGDFDNLANLSDRAGMKRLDIVRVESNFISNIKKETCSSEQTRVINNEPENKVRVCDENRDTDVNCEDRFLNSFNRNAMSRNGSEINVARCDGQNDANKEVLNFSPVPAEHKKEYSKQLPASNARDQNSSTTILIRDCAKTNNSSETNFSELSKIGPAESQTVTHSSVDIQKGVCNTSFPEKDDTLNTLAKTSNDNDSIAVGLNASKNKLSSEQKIFVRRGTQLGHILKEKAGILNRGIRGRKNMFDTRLSIQRMRAKLTSPMITSVMVEINEGTNHQNSSVDKSNHALSLSEIDTFSDMSNHDLSNEKSKSFPDKKVGKGTVEPNQREPVEIAVVCEGTASATKQIENQEIDTAKSQDKDIHSNDKDVGQNMNTQISKGCENHQKGKRNGSKKDVIPFNAVMKKKKEQYLKYKHGLVWNKFIDYNEFRNELRGNKKTEDSDTQEPTDIYQRQPFFRPFHRNVEYHLNNQKHHTPFVPFQMKNYQKNRKHPNSDALCNTDEESTRPFHNRSGNIGSKPVGNCNDADNESVDSYQPNRRQFQPFGGFRSFGFNHGKSGYFSWRRKYQTGPRYVGNERFYVTRKGVVQTEKEHREWKMFKERERIRIQIEGAVKDYRRTFEDSTDDMVGDEKVSKYLQSLTDKLDHIQNKRKLLHVQDQTSDSNIAQKRSVESVESLPKPKDDHVEVKRLVSVDNIRDQFDKSLKSSEQRQKEAPLVDALWRDHEGKSNQSEVLEKMLKEHFVKHLDNVTEKLKIELFAKLANETLGINAGEKRKTSSNQQHREVISKFVEKQLDVLRHSDEEKHNDRHHETHSTFGSESVRETSTDLEQYHEPDLVDYRHRRQRQYYSTKSKSPKASSSENISRGSRNNSDSRERYIPSKSYKRKRSYTRSRSRSRSRSSTPSRRFHSRDSHYWTNKRHFGKKYHRKDSYDRRSRSRSKSRYRSRSKSRSKSLDRARWRSRSSDKRSFDQYSDSSDRRRFGSGSRTRSRSRSRSWSTERRERKKCYKDAYINEDRFDYFDRGRENKYDNKEISKGDSRSYSEDTFKRCLNDAFKSKWDDTTEDDPIIISETTVNEDSSRNQNVTQPSSKGNDNADKNVNRTVSNENDSEETSRPDRDRNTLRKNEPTRNPFRNNNADTSYDDNTDGDHYNDDNNQKVWKRFHRDDDRYGYNRHYKSRGRFTWSGFRGRGDFSRGRGNYRHGYRDDWKHSRGSQKHFHSDKRYSPERHRFRKDDRTYNKYKDKTNYYGDKRKFMDDYDDDNCEYDDQGRYDNESKHYRRYTDRDNYADYRNDVIDLEDASYDDERHQYDGQYYKNRDSYSRDENGGDFQLSNSRSNHKDAEQESNSKSPQPIPTIYTR